VSVLITFEGGDGSGKSTQAKMLFEHLEEKGFDVVLTHEPGGTAFGERCRYLLLEAPRVDKFIIDPRAQVLGFCTARAQLVAEQIIPRLEKPNTITICDRYADSTIAYQVYGGGLSDRREEVERILSFATRNKKPDLTIYLDITVEEGLKRRQGRVKKEQEPHLFEEHQQLSFLASNHFDEQTMQFHVSVREGYEWLIAREPERFWRISAEAEIEEVAKEIQERIPQWLEAQGLHPKSKRKKREKSDEITSTPLLDQTLRQT